MTLMESSVAGTYADYRHALENGRIKLTRLEDLAHRGEIPLALFFAPDDVVKTQVKRKNARLLRGLTQKGTFQIGGRHEIRLGEIDLLLKDLLRKQEQLKKIDDSLTINPVMGRLGDPNRPSEDIAQTLVDLIGFSREQFQSYSKKADALEYFIDVLETKQILVSRSVRQTFMPQKIPKGFSGLTVRDKKIPYIFLPGGGEEEYYEPEGRRIFTLAILTVLVAQKTFASVTWNHGEITTEAIDSKPEKAYDIAGSFLMPARDLKHFPLTTCEEVEVAANKFQVTPSAVIVRAARSGMLPWPRAKAYLEEFRIRRELIPKNKGFRTPREAASIARYAGFEYVRRMFQAHDHGLLNNADFRLFVTLNRLQPDQFPELRRAVI